MSDSFHPQLVSKISAVRAFCSEIFKNKWKLVALVNMTAKVYSLHCCWPWMIYNCFVCWFFFPLLCRKQEHSTAWLMMFQLMWSRNGTKRLLQYSELSLRRSIFLRLEANSWFLWKGWANAQHFTFIELLCVRLGGLMTLALISNKFLSFFFYIYSITREGMWPAHIYHLLHSN